MWPDRVSNPGPLTYESGVLPIALRGPAVRLVFSSILHMFDWYFPQFCTCDMSKYGYLEVFQRVPSTSR